MHAMTREDAVAQILALTPLTDAEVNGLLDCSSDELSLLVASVKGRGAMPTVSTWDVVVAILKGCAETAGLVIPIVGAISGVYGLGKL